MKAKEAGEIGFIVLMVITILVGCGFIIHQCGDPEVNKQQHEQGLQDNIRMTKGCKDYCTEVGASWYMRSMGFDGHCNCGGPIHE